MAARSSDFPFPVTPELFTFAMGLLSATTGMTAISKIISSSTGLEEIFLAGRGPEEGLGSEEKTGAKPVGSLFGALMSLYSVKMTSIRRRCDFIIIVMVKSITIVQKRSPTVARYFRSNPSQTVSWSTQGLGAGVVPDDPLMI